MMNAIKMSIFSVIYKKKEEKLANVKRELIFIVFLPLHVACMWKIERGSLFRKILRVCEIKPRHESVPVYRDFKK